MAFNSASQNHFIWTSKCFNFSVCNLYEDKFRPKYSVKCIHLFVLICLFFSCCCSFNYSPFDQGRVIMLSTVHGYFVKLKAISRHETLERMGTAWEPSKLIFHLQHWCTWETEKRLLDPRFNPAQLCLLWLLGK